MQKRRKPIVCINTKTGEVVEDWKVIWHGRVDDPTRTRIRVNARGTEFNVDNVGVYHLDDNAPETLQIEEPASSDLDPFIVLPEPSKKFTKVFQALPLEFPSDSCYRFWHLVERHIEQDTGLVFQRTHEGNKYIESINDWCEFLSASRSSVLRFLKVALESRYLGLFLTGATRRYVVNPLYVWNGKRIPRGIAELFQDASE